MQNRLIYIILLFCTVAVQQPVYSQKKVPQNLENKFEGTTRRFHFGFLLGYNSSAYHSMLKGDYFSYDSLLSVTPASQPGFILAPLAVFHINKNWKIRLIPIQLSFEDRVLQFRYFESDSTVKSLESRVQSTYLQFPLAIKWRTDRLNNFAAYIIGGGQYGIDLQSNDRVLNSNTPADIIKSNRHAWDLQIGGGFDFFLKYFKFGIELKYSLGMKNMLIQDNSYYSSPLQELRNRSWVFSLTFEG